MIKAKTDLNERRNHRLIAAAERGHSNIVQKLLKGSADATALDNEGQTALELVVLFRQNYICTLVLEEVMITLFAGIF